MSNTNNQAHHREAFLALLEQEPPGVDYTSWLHGLCVGWRGAKALPATPTPATGRAS
jgi:hypothetical protein